MNPIIYNADYLFNETLINFEFPVEIHVTRFLNNNYPQSILNYFDLKENNKIISDNNYKEQKNYIKIFIDSNEPSVCYMKEKESDILKFAGFYNLLLTTNPNILKKVPHSKLFLYGTTWLNKLNKDKTYLGEIDETFTGFNLKKDDYITFLKSNKVDILINIVPGYDLREKIWSIKEKIKQPVKFYYSNVGKNNSKFNYDGPLPNDDKLNLFGAKYSIIIENSQEKNYFSEKLIDCLLTETIPIYWGCPNIDEYFDKNGFIFIEDEEDLLIKINNLNLNDFYSAAEHHIKNNFNIAKIYSKNYSKRLEDKITEILFDKSKKNCIMV
jgi:hypothetical protein